MPNDQAVYWLSVVVLLGLALMLGQFAAASIAAMACILLAYKNSPTLWKASPDTATAGI
jgi:hypothetical protein